MTNNAAVEEFDLDEVEVKSGRVEKFMVEKDKKYRVGFPLLNEKGRIKIVRVNHYAYSTGEGDDEKFNSWRASLDPKVNEAAEKAGAELKSHFVTCLIKYACNKDGQPLKPLQWEILPVKLDGTKVANLKEINAEWDLATIDVSISSSNPTYQYHTYTPLKKAIWLLEEGDPLLEKLGMEGPIKDQVLAAVAEAEKNMADAIAQEWKDATILRKIGESSSEEEAGGEDPTAALDNEFADLGDGDLG